jgi:hypothetical protein
MRVPSFDSSESWYDRRLRAHKCEILHANRKLNRQELPNTNSWLGWMPGDALKWLYRRQGDKECDNGVKLGVRQNELIHDRQED